jgi:catechol 2,3-dioxygenase-like lactoylglutathione lyase family enzyme
VLEFSELVPLVASTDLARSRQFYEGLLGLPVSRDRRSACDFSAGGTILRVRLVEHHEPQATPVLGWAVPDINSTVRTLAAHGLAFERYEQFDQDEWGIWEARDGSQQAWFKDPDGNLLCLTQQ